MPASSSRARAAEICRSACWSRQAAWWGENPPAAWDVELPGGFDLLVLDGAPLELAGRVALAGVVLFDDDPPGRVAWQAQTRLIYLDEEDRQRGLDRVFLGRG